MRERFTSLAPVLLLVAMLGGCATDLTPAPDEPAAARPTAAQARFEAGEAKLAMGDLEAAEHIFASIAERWPAFASPWTNLGYIYRHTGRPDEAIRALERAIERDPADCIAHQHLAAIHRARFDFEAAEVSYRACLEHRPDEAAAWLNLGVLYELYLGRLADALVAYERYQAAAINPDDRVEIWIADLSRRIEQSQHLAGND